MKRFKWLHLNEKINSERAARKKKLKLEISRAKKDTNKFKEIVEKEKKLKKLNPNQKDQKSSTQPFTYKQEKPFKEGIHKSSKVKANDENFLSNIFSGGLT